MSDVAPWLRRSAKTIDALLAALDEHRGDLVRARPVFSGRAADAADAAIRAIAEQRVELVRAQRVFREELDALTPVRPASSANLQAVRGIATRVGSILEGDKK